MTTTDASLGLALGGGGALGAAHVGVLRALEERRLRPGVVVGTSAGSLVGAAYATDLPLRSIEKLVRKATWSTFGRINVSPKLGLLDTAALVDTIRGLVGEPLIEELSIRFAAVATDPIARKEVAIDRGPLDVALRASIAVPGLFPPVWHEGRLLVDGGLAANLPLAAAKAMGAERVIAVRLRPEWVRLPIVPSLDRITALEQEPGVTVIRPDLAGMAQWSRSDVPRLIEAGYVAACQALDDQVVPAHVA